MKTDRTLRRAAVTTLAIIAAGASCTNADLDAEAIESATVATPAARPAMWIGGAANVPDASLETWQTFATHYGPLRVRRSFAASLPTSFASTTAGDDAASNVVSFFSVKPPSVAGVAAGDYDGQIREFAASLPSDHVTYLTMYHEPEGNMDGAQFVAMFRRFYTVAKAANPAVLVGTIHGSYQWRPRSTSTATPDDWWVGANYTDFTALDNYNPATTSGRTDVSNDPPFQRWYAWAASHGKPLAVTEFGRMEDPGDPNARAREILASETWLQDHGFFMFLYWDGTGSQGDWSLRSGPSGDAWQAVASRGRTGWGTPGVATAFDEEFEQGASGAAVTSANSGFNAFLGAPVFDGAVHYGGARSARFAGGTFTTAEEDLAPAPSRRVVERVVRVSALPGAGGFLGFVRARDGAALVAEVRLDATGAIELRRAGASVATSTTRVAADAWFRVRWTLDAAAGTQVLELFTDPAAIAPTETLRGAAEVGTFDRVISGVGTPGYAGSVWIDSAVDSQ